MSSALIALVIIAVWSLPIVIAGWRKHPHYWPIGVLTVLLGWTVLVWAVCLVWAVWPLPKGKPA